jgi:hypothetical protein
MMIVRVDHFRVQTLTKLPNSPTRFKMIKEEILH